MLWSLSWIIAIELLALGALPLAVHFFGSFPDRGYTFAKPLGMLVVAYLCWLTGTFGLLRFDRGTIAFVLVAVATASWVRWGRETLRELSFARRSILVSEALFLLFFAAAALVRAYNPEIAGTEKPMDFALMNSLYRGSALPPEDPWMSGFSMSYYYFGYLLIAMVAKLSGVPASVGYNLGVALVFALLLAGSFSLAFNLISLLVPRWRLVPRLLGSLLAPVLVGIMGNLEILFEVLANRAVGGAAFWNWVGVKGIQVASQPIGWFPDGHWWWWRASRIVPTTKPDGINEFPFFSFLLGDLHPHFTMLPWAVLAIAVALAALTKGGELWQGIDRCLWVVVPAVVLGALLVGNSWDFPSYTALFWLAGIVGALSAATTLTPALSQRERESDSLSQRESSSLSLWERVGVRAGGSHQLSYTLKYLGLVSICSVLLYSPFMLGFASQTRGIGLSADKTPLPSMLIIFGPFLLAMAGFLTWRGWPGRAEGASEKRLRVTLLLALGWLLILGSWFAGSSVLLLGFLALVGAAALSRPLDVPQRFLIILAALGFLLILGPEWVFLVDLFGTRMNTVFKFHYQAWLMLGLASSVGAAWLMGSARSEHARGHVHGVLRLAFGLGLALLVGVGLLYPLGATPSKADGFKGRPTLDGAAFYQATRPDDYAAIQWLSRIAGERAVVLEATGGEYSEYARVATFSGLPTVLGWAGHEIQWRGRAEEPQQRSADLDVIYRTGARDSVVSLLHKYGVAYVFVGSLETEKYGASVADRFEGMLDPVYRQGKVIIYKVPGSAA